jgi:HEXXH motif-containing protein
VNTHRVPPTVFEAVARGHGDPDAIRSLLAGRLSKHLFMLRGVLDNVRSTGSPEDADHFLANYAALIDLERDAPAQVTGVFAYPMVGAWLASCLRRQRRARADRGALGLDLAHLGSVAAAAAVRGRGSVTVTVPVRAGTVALPTLGRICVGGSDEYGFATLACAGDQIVVRRDGATPERRTVGPEAPGWEELRRAEVSAGDLTLTVAVDDIDPYRDGNGLGALPRLSASAWEEWSALLRRAWPILVTDHPRQAAAMTAGLAALVPLQQATMGHSRSVTQAAAAGAVALSLPSDPLSLALTLVHEMMHTKLNLLLDLVPMLCPTDRLYYSPWRPDPRPLWGLLHGTYAFLGVAEFWRIEARLRRARGRLAEFEFARAVHEVWTGHEELRASARLTAAGQRLVEIIGEAVAPWLSEPSTDLRRLASDLNRDHRAKWRMRNLTVDADTLDALVHAWRAGASPPSLPESRVVPGSDPRAGDPRLELARRLAEQTPLATALPSAAVPGGSQGDHHQLLGDYAAAAAHYSVQLGQQPEATDAWTGLAVACWRLSRDAGHRLMGSRPELVRMMHQRLGAADQAHVEPLAVAAWLATADAPRPAHP